MTFRAFRGSRPVPTRRGVTVGAVARGVGLLAAGCSAVTPAQEGSGAGARCQQRRGGRRLLRHAGAGRPGQGRRHAGHGAVRRAGPARPDPVAQPLLPLRLPRHVREALRRRPERARSCRSWPPRCPTISDGGKTVTIPVREGVKFADGTPFDAAAVKTTFDRNLTLDGSGRKSELGPITERRGPGRQDRGGHAQGAVRPAHRRARRPGRA